MMQLLRANADLYETDREVVAKFDIPGVKEDDITVEIVNDSLTVQVERTGEVEERRENAFLLERSFSGFYRSIPLPPEADQNNAQADYDDGVLTVRFPRIAGMGSGRKVPLVGKRGVRTSGRRGASTTEASSPYQERLSRDDMMRQGADSPLYRSGSGSYYSDTFERPMGDVAPESSFGSGNVSIPRMHAITQREAEVARREAEVARREMAAPFQQRLSREDMMKQGTDSPIYRSGSGSYYSDTFVRPTGEAAPESSFGRGTVAEPGGVVEKRVRIRKGER